MMAIASSRNAIACRNRPTFIMSLRPNLSHNSPDATCVRPPTATATMSARPIWVIETCMNSYKYSETKGYAMDVPNELIREPAARTHT